MLAMGRTEGLLIAVGVETVEEGFSSLGVSE